MKYSDLQRLKKMIETTEKLLAYIEQNGIEKAQVLAEETVRWTITTPLYNIGEHAYNLSDEFKNKHGDIPWSKVSGLRHRLVHDYENTNWTLICTVIFEILPDFLTSLRAIQSSIDGAADNI